MHRQSTGGWVGLGPQDRRKRPSRQRQQLKQRPGGGSGRRCSVRGDESSVIVVKDIRRQQWGKHAMLGKWDFIAFEMGGLRRFLSMRINKIRSVFWG